MSISLRLGLVIVSLVLLIVVLMQLEKRHIPVKYSLVWIVSSFLILFIAILPNIFSKISNFIFWVLIISLMLTVIVPGQRKKMTLLMQEVSMLKKK